MTAPHRPTPTGGLGPCTVVASCARGFGLESAGLSVGTGPGRAGDLVAARVTSVGSYPEVETPSGRDRRLRPGDVLVGVLGVRESTTSLYGGVPAAGVPLEPGDPLDLLAVGGVLGHATGWPSAMGEPTRLAVLGRVCRAGQPGEPLSLRPRSAHDVPRVPLILVGGTAAEVGKTTLSTKLVRHLADARGLRVGVCKLTGTGRMRDLLSLLDAGAVAGADFVDAGVATTYGLGADGASGVARWLVGRLAGEGVDVVVAELGGDLSGGNVSGILADPLLAGITRHLVVVGSDAMAAFGARCWLDRHGLTYRTSFAVPRRNPRANEQRFTSLLGVAPVDPDRAESLDRLVDAMELDQR